MQRDYVVPEDLFELAEDVVLHRIRLSYEALAEGQKPATGAGGIAAETRLIPLMRAHRRN